MRPIQGTPFSGGSPFASSMSKGMSSSSMMGGLGGFNMPPMASAGMMGRSSPFSSGGGSPFGAGSKALSDGIKKLVDSNKDLIAAIKDLTKSIRALEKGMGGGPGGAQSPGSRIGLGGQGGMDSLNARMLQRLAGGMSGASSRNQSVRDSLNGQGDFSGFAGSPHDAFSPAGRANINNLTATSDTHSGAIQRSMMGGRLQRFGTAAYNMGRGLFGLGARNNIPLPGSVAAQRASDAIVRGGGSVAGRGPMHPGTGMYEIGAQANQAASANASGAMAGFQRFGAGLRNMVMNAGAGTNAAEIISQIPYVGGMLSAPLQVLEGRKAAAMAVEMPSMVYTGVSQGTTQAGDPMAANGGLIRAGASMLGMNAADTLNAATQMVQSGGIRRQVSGNDLSSAIASGLGFGLFGAAEAGQLRGSGVRGLKGFEADSLRRQMFAAGLTGQGASKYLNAMLSVGEQFTGMGINLQGGAASEIGGIMARGGRSFEGDAAAGAYTRMRLKGGVAVGQQLGGTFSGLGQNMLMAEALDATGGDFFQARRRLERMEPSQMKARLTSMLGEEVAGMAMMGMGFTTDEIKAIGKGRLAEQALPTGPNAGAIITKADAESNNRKLQDTYDNQIENIKKLIKVNERIETKLLDGLDIDQMETLINTISDASSVLRSVAGTIVTGIADIIQGLRDFFSDERLKEDIKHIGYSPSGLKIYSWKYKHNPCATFSGVMAQDILNIIPEAISTDERGYYMVNYKLLDVDMHNISMGVA
tara:strand:- start:6217 stop:8484 length:2268 start_codon:yes stop_codon:yes gene_type:complete